MKLRFAPAVLLLAVAGCGGGSQTAAIPAGGATTAATTSATAAAPAPAGCTAVKKPPPKPSGKLKNRSKKLDPAKTWTATVKTNCGTFPSELAARKAPTAPASIAFLARRRYFARTIFHRIVPGFVIQGGDPTAAGSGGPGYSTRDKPPNKPAHTRGVVAMAKNRHEPPGTPGSPIFLMTRPHTKFPPEEPGG